MSIYNKEPDLTLTLKEDIDNLKWEIIEESFKEQKKIKELNNLIKLRHKNIKPFFIWKLEFSDVFKEKGGFDIVIGNPPYVRVQGLKSNYENEAKLYEEKFVSATGKYDLYVLFNSFIPILSSVSLSLFKALAATKTLIMP